MWNHKPSKRDRAPNCDALAKYHRETLHNHVRDAAAALLNGRTKARDLCKASAGIALPTGVCHTEKEHEYGGKRYRPDLTVDPATGDRAPTLELEIIWSSKPTDARLEAASRAGRLIACAYVYSGLHIAARLL